MGTHPIFESDFDCLTDHRPRNKMSHPANPGYHQVLQPVNAPPSQVVSSVGGGQPGQPGQQNVRFASQTYRGAPQRIIVQHSGGVIDQQDLKLISKLNLNKLARDVDPNAILEDEVIDLMRKLS